MGFFNKNQTTGSSGNIEVLDSEIKDARGKYSTIGKRFNNVDSQLDHIINKTTDIYYLSEYVKNINENNDENIKKMVSEINSNPNNVKVIFNIPKLILYKPLYI